MASFLLLDKQGNKLQGPRFNAADREHKPQVQERYPARSAYEDILPSPAVGQAISVSVPGSI